MCSAMGQRPILKEALDAGALDFIIKPFEESKVIELLNEIYEE
jgi:two-component system chemotaxis response regulator CheY